MRKYFILPVLLIVLQACGYIELRNKNLIRPKFDNQRSLVINQSPFIFHPFFKVYTTDYGVFLFPEDKKEGTLFDIKKSFHLFEDIFIIKNLKSDDTLFFKQISDDKNDRKQYKIYNNKNDLITIRQKFKQDYETFSLEFENIIYDLTIDYKSRNEEELHSVELTLSEESNIYLKIFKQQYYFKNNYEVYINADFDIFGDSLSVSIGIFLDYILKNEGIFYKD